MSNSDSIKNLEHGQRVPVRYASSAFLETPANLLINVKSGPGKKPWHVEQISFHCAYGVIVTIHEFMMTTIKFL